MNPSLALQTTIFIMIVISIGIFVLILLHIIDRLPSKSNPLDSISFSECMGFRIGDSKRSVMSKIKRRKLLTPLELDTHRYFQGLYNNEGLRMPDFTIIYHNTFDNIEDISLYFERNRLSNIYIQFKPHFDSFDIIKDLVQRKVGSPALIQPPVVIWLRNKQAIIVKPENQRFGISISPILSHSHSRQW